MVCFRTFPNRPNLSWNHPLSAWCCRWKQNHQILANLLITRYRDAFISTRQHLGFNACDLLTLVQTTDHQLGHSPPQDKWAAYKAQLRLRQTSCHIKEKALLAIAGLSSFQVDLWQSTRSDVFRGLSWDTELCRPTGLAPQRGVLAGAFGCIWRTLQDDVWRRSTRPVTSARGC